MNRKKAEDGNIKWSDKDCDALVYHMVNAWLDSPTFSSQLYQQTALKALPPEKIRKGPYQTFATMTLPANDGTKRKLADAARRLRAKQLGDWKHLTNEVERLKKALEAAKSNHGLTRPQVLTSLTDDEITQYAKERVLKMMTEDEWKEVLSEKLEILNLSELFFASFDKLIKLEERLELGLKALRRHPQITSPRKTKKTIALVGFSSHHVGAVKQDFGNLANLVTPNASGTALFPQGVIVDTILSETSIGLAEYKAVFKDNVEYLSCDSRDIAVCLQKYLS